MPNLPDVVLWSIPAFVLLTVIEMVSLRIHPDENAAGYESKDAATSVGMGLGSLVFDFLWKIPIVAVYSAIYAVTPLRVPVLWWTVPLMLLGQDFFYYWSHRGHHVIRILWACHVVHHSSRKFNLTTALRQPWTTWTVWPFYVPLIALGVHPAALAFCSSANLVYQFWIHTERIDKLPRWFEFVFNTPPTTVSTMPPRAAIWTATSVGSSSSGTGSSDRSSRRPSGPSTGSPRTSPRTTPCASPPTSTPPSPGT